MGRFPAAEPSPFSVGNPDTQIQRYAPAIVGIDGTLRARRIGTPAQFIQMMATGGEGVIDGNTAGIPVTIRGTEFRLDAAGMFLRFMQAGMAQATVGAAGGAAAPPATPTTYFKVRDSAGTLLVIPAYAAV